MGIIDGAVAAGRRVAVEAAPAVAIGAEQPLRGAAPLRPDRVGIADGGIAVVDGRAAGPGDVVLAWSASKNDLARLDAAIRQGALVLNDPAAIAAAHRKGDMSTVLERAGVATIGPATTVRTEPELRAAVAELGGEARMTGGFSHSRSDPDSAVDRAVPAHLDTPEPRLLRSPADVDAAVSSLDHERLFALQPIIEGPTARVTLAGDHVLDVAGDVSASSLTSHELDQARRTLQAYGLDAGQVTITRSGDAGSLVVDVHPTPILSTERLAELADSPEVAALAEAPRGPQFEGTIAAALEREKPSVGVLNMGFLAGKNISRTLAEVERQGGHPEFLSVPRIGVDEAGALRMGGQPGPRVDAFVTRTGSIISDGGLATLRDLERTGKPIINRASAMELVRDKNVQAETLRAAGVAHPDSAVVHGPEDIGAALAKLGSSMVLKNPASSEGRGVMFLDGEDAIRGTADLFARRTDHSTLVAEAADGASGLAPIPVASRHDAEQAVQLLGAPRMTTNAATGADELAMQAPIRLRDTATGAATTVDRPLSVLTVTDAFADAKPGATLKAEHWYREASGVDTRIHVMRNADDEHEVVAAMRRVAAPNIYGEARSNLSLGGHAEAVELTPEQADMAIRSARAFDLDIAGVDEIATDAGPVVLEMNSSPGLDIEMTVGPVADRWIGMAMTRARAAREAAATTSGGTGR